MCSGQLATDPKYLILNAMNISKVPSRLFIFSMYLRTELATEITLAICSPTVQIKEMYYQMEMFTQLCSSIHIFVKPSLRLLYLIGFDVNLFLTQIYFCRGNQSHYRYRTAQSNNLDVLFYWILTMVYRKMFQ